MTECLLSLQRSILHTMRSQILAEFFHHHGFVIGPVAQIHLRNGLALEGDDVRADSIEEPSIIDLPPSSLNKGLRLAMLILRFKYSAGSGMIPIPANAPTEW